MAQCDLKNIESLLNLTEILATKVGRLTAPGENYGSLMLSVDVVLEGTKEIHAVAKTVPPNEFIQEIFNTPVTFKNEIGFYKNIVPVLQNFQRENGVKEPIDCFPKYLGSRLNLTGGPNVDPDAALVLENLKVLNYVTLDRIQGCDFKVTKSILSALAQLHAVPLALKLQKPQVFQKEVVPFLEPWYPNPAANDSLRKEVVLLIDKLTALEPYRKRILEAFDRQIVPREAREPWATLSHNDCWVNNAMVKLDETKTKLVDFQICSYGSPARDIVFFMFSSVKTEVIKEKYRDLVKWYHQEFVSVLKELKCGTEQFTLESLEKEMEIEARNTQFGHVAFMLFPIFAEKGQVLEIEKLTPENMVTQEPSEKHKQKFLFVVEEFVKRNWI